VARADADEARAAAEAAHGDAEVAREDAEVAREDTGDGFGRLGRPLRRDSPFMLGFLGALGVFLAWFLTQALLEARGVLVLILIALFLAIGLNPTVEWLTGHNMRRGAAIAIVFFGVIGAFVGFGFAVVPPVVEQSNAFVKELPSYLDDLRKNPTVRQFDEDYGVIERAQDYVTSGELGQRAFGGLLGVGRVVLNAVFGAFTVLIMTLYFLAALPSMKRQTYRLVPASRRERVTLLGDEVLARTGGFVSGALSVAFIAAFCSYVFLRIVDLPYAIALAVFVGLLDLIPLVGATIGAVVVAVITLFVDFPVATIVWVVYSIVYQQVENTIIQPQIQNRAVEIQPFVVLVSVLFASTLFGILGALLAIPVAASLSVVIREYRGYRRAQAEHIAQTVSSTGVPLAPGTAARAVP
jgi:predicted PurR-regulated permease PerM